jgi:hypothetical protein
VPKKARGERHTNNFGINHLYSSMAIHCSAKEVSAIKKVSKNNKNIKNNKNNEIKIKSWS